MSTISMIDTIKDGGCHWAWIGVGRGAPSSILVDGREAADDRRERGAWGVRRRKWPGGMASEVDPLRGTMGLGV